MLSKILFICFLLLSVCAFGSEHSKMDTLGVSSAGHIVALEEYGYTQSKHTYYVNIKFLNVWTKEYVGTPINVEMPAIRKNQLMEARKKARELASGDLQKYKISG